MATEPPEGAARDWTIPQGWERYTAAEHEVWRTLYARQRAALADRAVPEFLEGLALLDMGSGIPDFRRLSERLMSLTGWQVVAVPGLVPEAVFFEHLANRRFVAGNFIRKPEELDYLEAPDVFHDVFGHVPLLAHPVFANYMEAYGRGGLRAMRLGALDKLARLYWYTVEFGLIETPAGLRIYGAGILSSLAESRYALESPKPRRLAFDLERVLRTRYRIDAFQDLYFVIPSFEALLRQTLETDFAPLYRRLATLPDLAIDAELPSDRPLALAAA
ncbi:phenylalanine 4-monooxygenase [Thermaurantiacus sp.]